MEQEMTVSQFRAGLIFGAILGCISLGLLSIYTYYKIKKYNFYIYKRLNKYKREYKNWKGCFNREDLELIEANNLDDYFKSNYLVVDFNKSCNKSKKLALFGYITLGITNFIGCIKLLKYGELFEDFKELDQVMIDIEEDYTKQKRERKFNSVILEIKEADKELRSDGINPIRI